MEPKIDVDGFTLMYNYRFLNNLSREKFIISSIRVKYVKSLIDFNNNGSSILYRTFPNIESFKSYFDWVLLDPKFSCYVGKFTIIESMNVINESLNFPNSYYIRNISSSPTMQKNYKLDSYRSKFNESQVNLYESYLNQTINDYRSDLQKVYTYRMQQYIDPCYIDINYFKGDDLKLVKF